MESVRYYGFRLGLEPNTFRTQRYSVTTMLGGGGLTFSVPKLRILQNDFSVLAVGQIPLLRAR
jgi:hypothetical protein